jgi:hypothetical protein
VLRRVCLRQHLTLRRGIATPSLAFTWNVVFDDRADGKMLSVNKGRICATTEFTNSDGIVRQRHSFLRLIILFFNRPVMLTGLRLGLTMCVLSKYEKFGFFLLMLSVAF